MENKDQIRRVILLSYFNSIFNITKGSVAIFLGIYFGSTTLLAFGAAGIIELCSSLLVIWRFNNELTIETDRKLAKEKKVTISIGVLLILLSIIIIYEAVEKLVHHFHPAIPPYVAIISVLNILVVTRIWQRKKKLSEFLNSTIATLDTYCTGEGLKLSVTLLIGNLLFFLLKESWWVDSVFGIILATLLGNEGLHTIKFACAKDFEGGSHSSHFKK